MSRRRVLIVDDDEDVLSVFQRAFQRAGYEVATARSSDVALEWIRESEGADFELAVLDLLLGGQTSGFQLARRLRELQPRAGILLVSGFVGETPPRMSLPGGRVEFLAKPVELDELLDAASRLLEKGGRRG